MRQQVQFQTKEGQPISKANYRDYTTITRAIKLAIQKKAKDLLAIDQDGRSYDYTQWLQNRQTI